MLEVIIDVAVHTYHDYFTITRLTRPLQVEATLVHFTVREKIRLVSLRFEKGVTTPHTAMKENISRWGNGYSSRTFLCGTGT